MSNSPQPEKIADRYEVRKAIGSGARGTVYLAFDSLLLNNVAIKMLHYVDRDESIVRFQHEAKATGRLKHSCIAGALDFGIADGSLYLVMEYVDGESLAQILDREKSLPLDRALPLFIDICSGLAHAHAQGIFHRDLKPANVIIFKTEGLRESAKLVDFGIAKMLNEEQRVTDPDAIVGSPAYMSPEQGNNKPADARSDIYSLGCLMFETLAGKLPIAGDTALDTIKKKIASPSPSLGEFVESNEAMDVLVRVVDTCLRTDPALRFQNVSAIQQELETIDLDEKPDEALGPVEAVAKKPLSVKNKVVVGAIVTVFSLVLIGSVAMIWHSGGNKSPTLTPIESNLPKPVELGVKKAPDMPANARSAPGKSGDNFVLDFQNEVTPAVGGTGSGDVFLVPKGNRFELLVHSGVRDADMAQLKDRKGVRRLYLDRAGFLTKEGIKHIEKIPFEGLVFSQTNLDDAAVAVISRMKSLHTLRLMSADHVTDEGLKYISTMTNLDDLQIGSCSISDKGVEYISHLPDVNFLTLCNSTLITDASVPYINSQKGIEDLKIYRTGISAAGVAEIARHQPKVRIFEIDGLPINDDVIDAISKMPKLTELRMFDCPITNEQLKKLSESKITDLFCSCSRVNEIGIGYLGRRHFSMLCLSDLNVTRSCLQALEKLDVDKLELQRPEIYNEQLQMLAGIKHLSWFRVCNCSNKKVSRRGIDLFKQAYFTKRHKECHTEYDPIEMDLDEDSLSQTTDGN